MTFDDRYIYVFVRQDIPLAQQMVDVAHAAYHTGNDVDDFSGKPSLIVIGVPDEKRLTKALGKLNAARLISYTWIDPDNAFGPTAIATYPITREEKQPLASYRLWSYSPAPTVLPTVKAGLNADGGANAAVAHREHPIFNGEDGNSRLPSGSSSEPNLSEQ